MMLLGIFLIVFLVDRVVRMKKIKCIVRHGSVEDWEEFDPVLRERELVIGYDGDLTGYKLGDGRSRWSDLPYVDLNEVERFSMYIDGLEIEVVL